MFTRMKIVRFVFPVVAVCLLPLLISREAAAQPQGYIKFDGSAGNYLEIQDPPMGDFSVNPGVGLTISAWFRPDALHFDLTDGSTDQYVHWFGKGCPVDLNGDPSKCIGRGESDTRTGTPRQEWTFRIYSQALPLPCPPEVCVRQNRISFYAFNWSAPEGQTCQNEGIGSYFQQPVEPGGWIHVVGVIDDHEDLTQSPRAKTTSIYKDGNFIRCDQYQPTGAPGCQRFPDQQPGQCPRAIFPAHGPAPVRMGRRDRDGYFNGAIGEVRVWNRPLSSDEVAVVYSGVGPLPDGLVGEYLLNGTADDTSGNPNGPNNGMVNGTTWSWGSNPPPPVTAQPKP
jgi:hypothetical protein